MTQRKNSKTEIPDSKITETEIPEIHVPPDRPPQTLEELQLYRESLPSNLKRKRPPGPLAPCNSAEYLKRTEELRDAQRPLPKPNRKPILKPLFFPPTKGTDE